MEAKSAKKEISSDSVVVPRMDVPKIIDLKKIHKGWSNLPTDLLQEIMAELTLADQIRFRSVCKNWVSLPFQVSRPMDKLPWLLNIDWYGMFERSKIYWKLFDPIHEKPYTTFGKSTGDKAVDCIYRSPFSITSKHGWVFYSMENMDTGHTSFILFSPFTKEIMTLPDLYHGVQNKYQWTKKLTFSSEPTSKECVLFVVFYEDYSSTVVVGTYKDGYKEWITKRFHWRATFIKSMVYFEGKLYCFDDLASTSVYNVAEQYWDFAKSFKSECKKYGYVEHHLLESNGELLLVCIKIPFDRCGIYRFNNSSKRPWVAKKSLPNQALFISRNSISVPAIGEMKHIENKVFYYDRSRKMGKFYSLIDGKSYNCEGTEYECLFKNENSVRGIWVERTVESKVGYIKI